MWKLGLKCGLGVLIGVAALQRDWLWHDGQT